jgi:hypothetical protein
MGGRVGSDVPRDGGRKREIGGRVSRWAMGPEWLWAARSEGVARARGGGRLANRGGWRGERDAADRWGQAATGPSVSGGVREGEG